MHIDYQNYSVTISKLSALLSIETKNIERMHTRHKNFLQYGSIISEGQLYRRFPMNTKRTLLFASISVFCTSLIPGSLMKLAFSVDTQDEDASIFILEGLKGVNVEVVQPVSGFEDKPRFNPVNVEELRTMVRKLLTEAKIEVFDNTSDDPDIGHVVVTINVWKSKLAINFIVQVKTELYQQATLIRNDTVQILTTTWPLVAKAPEARKPMIVTRHYIAPTVQQQIKKQVKMLIGDYLEVNPLPEPMPGISGMMTGTIRYCSHEGGCYHIYADNGVVYYPVNLPIKYKRHGLRVAFRAVRSDLVGVPFGGVWIELTRIVEL
jgi:hypothetical protein